MKLIGYSLLLVILLTSSSVKVCTEVENGNQFAFDILNKLSKSNPSANLVLSPYGIRNCFAYVYPGAGGNTKKEIQNTLLFDDSPETQLRLFKESNSENTRLKDSKVMIANSMWVRDNFPLNKSYSDLVKKYTDAVNTLTTEKKVNEWVAAKTNNSIKELVKDGDLLQVKVLLLNCLALDAQWKTPFDTVATKQKNFYTNDNKILSVPTMHGEISDAYGGYFEDASQKIVQLAYKDDLSMTIVMPKQKNDNINLDSKMRMRLTSKKYPIDNSLWTNFEFVLNLPKFKIESAYDLIPTLYSMGIKDAFSEGDGNFKGMHPDLIIGLVKQKAIIEVNEAGTKASAATAIGMVTRGGPPPSFSIDRPFYYIIHNSRTGEILFMGKVVNPLL